MKISTVALLFAFAIGTLATGTTYESSEHPGKCVYSDLVLLPGEHGKPAGKCEQFHCEAGFKGRIEPCDYRFIILEPPCWWGEIEDHSKPYPECCMRKVICPKSWKGK
ncbi:uncharacterized protein LOC106094258 [Stomoxys calcitrans]|uniref:uncharacterized protein LOC106094258 n=1 Tax=Stomoxys calcitrans TaxID=35570 RepID=UPI0027E37E22|nr:uncharacterized protein LOC106094258 [Stomoxys calcitrans]